MLSLLITLVVIGALLSPVLLLPIDGVVKQIIYVIAIVAVLIWVLRHFDGVVGLG